MPKLSAGPFAPSETIDIAKDPREQARNEHREIQADAAAKTAAIRSAQSKPVTTHS